MFLIMGWIPGDFGQASLVDVVGSRFKQTSL